jgi:protein TonB
LAYLASQSVQRRRRLISLTVVVVLHVLLAFGLAVATQFDRNAVIERTVEALLIEEIKPPPPPPPPPPPQKKPPPPVPEPPPPVYVPPVEVPIKQEAPTKAIQATTTQLPKEPPRPPVRQEARLSASSECAAPNYPVRSLRENEQGTVVVRFLVSETGKVLESVIGQSSGFRRLDSAAQEALALCNFSPETVDGVPRKGWATIRYIWKIE